MIQFVNSVRIICRNEHRNRALAMARHVYWQARKLAFPMPTRLRLSRSLIVDNEPGGVISLVNMLGLYDFNNMNFVQAVLARAKVFFDIGANIGSYTLIGSEIPSVRVISLEPIPEAFAKLQRNLALNCRSNVVALNVAASREPGVLRMTNDGASSVNHVLRRGETNAGAIEVCVRTVDEICRDLGVLPDIMKIDVEGHEPEVLAGGTASMASLLACIVENGERAEIMRHMAAHGFLGPFYYRHRFRRLMTQRQPLAEDAIFISPRFACALPDIEISGHEGDGAGSAARMRVSQ